MIVTPGHVSRRDVNVVHELTSLVNVWFSVALVVKPRAARPSPSMKARPCFGILAASFTMDPVSFSDTGLR